MNDEELVSRLGIDPCERSATLLPVGRNMMWFCLPHDSPWPNADEPQSRYCGVVRSWLTGAQLGIALERALPHRWWWRLLGWLGFIDSRRVGGDE